MAVVVVLLLFSQPCSGRDLRRNDALRRQQKEEQRQEGTNGNASLGILTQWGVRYAWVSEAFSTRLQSSSATSNSDFAAEISNSTTLWECGVAITGEVQGHVVRYAPNCVGCCADACDLHPATSGESYFHEMCVMFWYRFTAWRTRGTAAIFCCSSTSGAPASASTSSCRCRHKPQRISEHLGPLVRAQAGLRLTAPAQSASETPSSRRCANASAEAPSRCSLSPRRVFAFPPRELPARAASRSAPPRKRFSASLGESAAHPSLATLRQCGSKRFQNLVRLVLLGSSKRERKRERGRGRERSESTSSLDQAREEVLLRTSVSMCIISSMPRTSSLLASSPLSSSMIDAVSAHEFCSIARWVTTFQSKGASEADEASGQRPRVSALKKGGKSDAI
eukprot:scaffold434_cov186-Pinguiococcus_pyrenoidosus.AAC.122